MAVLQHLKSSSHSLRMQCKTILMDRRVAITNPCDTSVDIKCFVEILVALGETKLIMRNGFRHKMWILISQCLASSVREGKAKHGEERSRLPRTFAPVSLT